jgi:murein DD-endopeptidase MepM/ murein hydrolase activator NlpD
VFALNVSQETANAQSALPHPLPKFRPPVAGRIVDNWRPPVNPYGAGNRGIDLAAMPGEMVHAVGDGTVTFAGQVGGHLFVVVSHSGGIRTTVGFLATVTVRKGDTVRLGQVVATAKGPVHLGVRVGTTYVDPRPLFAGKSVWLVA